MKKKKPLDPTGAKRQRRYIANLKAAAKDHKKTKKLEKADDAALELVEHALSKLKERVVLLEGQVKKLDELFATMIRMSNPVAQPRYRSGEWHMRSGNVMQNAALPDSPNAEKAETPASPEIAGKTADDPGGNLPSLK